MVARICVDLPGACASLDDDAAAAMFDRDPRASTPPSACSRTTPTGPTGTASSGRLADSAGLHGLVQGRCCRLLLDAGVLDADEAAPADEPRPLRRRRPARRPRPGSRGSSGGAARSSCTTPPSGTSSTAGSPRSPPTPSCPSCRCSAGPSPPSPPPSAGRWASGPGGGAGHRAVGRRPPRPTSTPTGPRPSCRWSAMLLGVRDRGRRMEPPDDPDDERLRRWRLILGGDEADGTGAASPGTTWRSTGPWPRSTATAGQGGTSRRTAGAAWGPRRRTWPGGWATSASSSPRSVVRVMQKDALERLDLRQMLLEPELLEAVEPDVHLVADLISLRPGHARQDQGDGPDRSSARSSSELERRLAEPMRQAVMGSLEPRRSGTAAPGTTRSTGTGRSGPTSSTTSPSTGRSSPRPGSATAGSGRRSARSSSASTRAARWPPRSSTPGSSARCWRACRRSRRSVVVFDTAVVDLTDELHDPVDLLFGTQLGGGTDINRALAYCQGLIRRPAGDDPRPDQRPLRRGRPAPRCSSGPRALVGLGRADGRPAGPERRRRPELRPRGRRRVRPSWASPSSPARPTSSPT